MFYCHIHHWCSAEAPCPVCSTGYSTTTASTFNNGGQMPAYGNEKSAHQLIRERENKIRELKCAADVYTCKIKELKAELEITSNNSYRVQINLATLVHALFAIINDERAKNEIKDIASGALKSVGVIK